MPKKIIGEIDGNPAFDSHKLAKLSDADFRKYHQSAMELYLKEWEEHRVFKEKSTCPQCFDEVQQPGQMVRYYGNTFHPDCFREVYTADDNVIAYDRRYWDRISKLIK